MNIWIKSERDAVRYNDLCPSQIGFETNQGFYVLCKTLHNKVQN
jgi:hypothetical protein